MKKNYILFLILFSSLAFGDAKVLLQGKIDSISKKELILRNDSLEYVIPIQHLTEKQRLELNKKYGTPFSILLKVGTYKTQVAQNSPKKISPAK